MEKVEKKATPPIPAREEVPEVLPPRPEAPHKAAVEVNKSQNSNIGPIELDYDSG